MSTVPMICVKDVEKTSKLLQSLFSWKSSHGGKEFDDLVDDEDRSVLWLHHLSSHDHPRFKDVEQKSKGVGLAIYVVVPDIDKVYSSTKQRKLKVVEELATNQNAGFREFTLQITDGYMFSVCEKSQWFKI